MFDEVFDIEHIYKAHALCRRNKQHKDETINFESMLPKNINTIVNSIKNRTYKPYKYRCFVLHEPKRRVVHSLSYLHRIVQRTFCDNILIAHFEKKLIFDNCACRQNKGTHFALKRLRRFVRLAKLEYGNNFYYLQCDISKYFENIDHEILKDKLIKSNLDKDSLWLAFRFIDSFNYEEGKGIPIGNQTSQWFALYYLDGLDHFIKERLKIKFYLRYMDDFILIHNNKNYLKFCLEKISKIISSLKLRLNQKTQINKISRGINFLGFRTTISSNGKIVRFVRGQAKKRFKINKRKLNFLVRHKVVDNEFINVRFRAYKNHYLFGNCHKWFYSIASKIKSVT